MIPAPVSGLTFWVAVRVCALVLTLGAPAAFASVGAADQPESGGPPITTSANYGYDSPLAATTHLTNTRTVAPVGSPNARVGPRSSTAPNLQSRAAKGETTLYRAVSDAELDDIAKNGLRVNPSGRGYQTEKLFTGSAEDAARQAQIAHKLSGQVSTIIEARFPSGVDILRGRADSMDIFSVPAGSLSRGRLSHVFRDASPRP